MLPPGQPVEEGVGRAISGLAESAPHRGNRGDAEEEIQLQVGGRFAQMPSTPNLAGKHPVHFGFVEVAQRSGTNLARCVHDAGQRRHVGCHGS